MTRKPWKIAFDQLPISVLWIEMWTCLHTHPVRTSVVKEKAKCEVYVDEVVKLSLWSDLCMYTSSKWHHSWKKDSIRFIERKKYVDHSYVCYILSVNPKLNVFGAQKGEATDVFFCNRQNKVSFSKILWMVFGRSIFDWHNQSEVILLGPVEMWV